MPDVNSTRPTRSTRNVNANSKTTATPSPKKDDGKKLQVVLESLNSETSFYTRKDGTEMERQTGLGFCEQINADVFITRTLEDENGNAKTMLTEAHIGKTLNAIVNKVADKDGNGFVFFAEVSLSRPPASQESCDLFDSI